MSYRQLKKKPSHETFAKNVPSKGLHGYQPTLSKEADYWEKRSRTTLLNARGERGASFLVAHEMRLNLAIVEVALLAWMGFGAVNRGLERQHPEWNDWNHGRRDALGIVALSKLCRDALPDQSHTAQRSRTQAIDPRERRMDLIPDISLGNLETNGIVDARLHVSRERADNLLGSCNPESERALWYRSMDGSLYVRREVTINPTPLCDGLGSEENQANLQTLFPYVASR